jgi:RNA-splicing ligase RtcB
MIILQGKHNIAKVFTNNLEGKAAAQIIELCNQEFCGDSQIRIMPDTHAGAECTIGTTMTIKDKLVPNLVGVDIGCVMEVTVLKDRDIDLEALDKVIRDFVPSGFDSRKHGRHHRNNECD